MKNIAIMTLFTGILTLTACNDWLDVKPQTQVESNELFRKEKGFKDALTSCYTKLNSENLYGKSMTLTDIEFLAQHWDTKAGDYQDAALIKNFEYTTTYAENVFKDIYKELYNTIAQANIVLENLKTNGDVIKKERLRSVIEAEALGIRAFCHTDVLRLFGQLPQNATKQVSLPYAETVSIQPIPYYSFAEFTGLILRDIKAAQALLKDHDPVFQYTFSQLDNDDKAEGNQDGAAELEDDFLFYRRFRFNYYALEALKARLYLYTNHPAEAYEAAKKVIDARDPAGRKMLTLGGAADFGKDYYALPSECILALSNSSIGETAQYLFTEYGLFLNNSHYSNLFQGQETNNRKSTWKKNGQNPLPIWIIKKYEQPSKDAYTSTHKQLVKHQIVPLLRLSEMYLIAIETAPSASEANTLYTEYMAARNVNAATFKREEILKEYRREFFAEGQMFFTYKRLGATNMLWKNDREISESDYLVPLPATELKSNL